MLVEIATARAVAGTHWVGKVGQPVTVVGDDIGRLMKVHPEDLVLQSVLVGHGAPNVNEKVKYGNRNCQLKDQLERMLDAHAEVLVVQGPELEGGGG